MGQYSNATYKFLGNATYFVKLDKNNCVYFDQMDKLNNYGAHNHKSQQEIFELREAYNYREFGLDLAKLLNKFDINATAVCKILKKFDVDSNVDQTTPTLSFNRFSGMQCVT
jgi:hypothetical protein